MNPRDLARWRSEVLDEVFPAVVSDSELGRYLVFKGARVLNILLEAGRQSLDLDSNLTVEFVRERPDREEQRKYLETRLRIALSRHFERADLVRYRLAGIRVVSYPPSSHPMGWDAFKVKLNIVDLSNPGVRGLPGVEIDVAAPEELLDSSVSEMMVGGRPALGYTLERIAGEKMRAFLSSLPAYRKKVGKPGDSVRAKDLYDLARIHARRSIQTKDFWEAASKEFRIACRSRYVDCAGIETFSEQIALTSETYAKDATIPRDVAFAEAWSVLEAVVDFMATRGVVPFRFDLPDMP